MKRLFLMLLTVLLPLHVWAQGGNGPTGTIPQSTYTTTSTIGTGLPAGCSGTTGTGTIGCSGSISTVNWQRLGTVIGVPSSPGFYQEVAAFVQTTPQVLSGYPQVVGLIFSGDPANNIFYAEAPSPAGPFTFYSSSGPGGSPTVVLANVACASNIQTLGGQLVMFGCAARTDIHRYHSVTNGISWVDDGAEISHGGGGWKNGYVENPFYLVVGSTCHLWFEGATTLSVPLLIGQGHATSSSTTCAHGTFTEDAGDPVIPTAEFNGGGPFVYYDGANFWQWEHGTPGGSADAYPTNIYVARLNGNGSGTQSPHTHTEVFQSRYPDEGVNQTGENAQVADPFLFEWPYAQGDGRNSTYLYYTSCANYCATNEQMSLKVAVIPAPLKTIVANFTSQTDTATQVIAVPQPYTSCTDSGARANSTNGGAQWSAGGGTASNVAGLQIASNTFESGTVNDAARDGFNGCPFGASQSSSVTFVAGASTSVIGPAVRISSGSGVQGVNDYECVTAAALGGSQSMLIRKIVNGVVSATIATFTATPAVNDVWKLSATGTNPTNLSCTQNGVQPAGASGTDASSPLTSGQPGMVLFDSAAVANAQVKNWIGGAL